MLLLAAIVMFDGFFGSQVAPANLAGVLPWTYWREFRRNRVVARQEICFVWRVPSRCPGISRESSSRPAFTGLPDTVEMDRRGLACSIPVGL